METHTQREGEIETERKREREMNTEREHHVCMVVDASASESPV